MASADGKSVIQRTLEKELTETVLASLNTWDEALAWAKFKPEDWKAVSEELGDEGVADYLTIANVSDEDYLAAAVELKLKGIAKARLNVAINIARVKLGMEVTDIFANPGPASQAALPVAGASQAGQPSAPQEQAGILKNGLNASTIWDQGLKIVVAPVGASKLQEARQRWLDLHELEPSEDVLPTDKQLSMLFRLMEIDHNILAFDMGVWGPWGGRRERTFTLMAHVQGVDGTYMPKELPGPRSLEDWCAAWDFATVAYVMCGAISEGVASAYKKFFVQLAKNYPKCWWLAAQVEWQLRHEWALAERRRQEAFYAANPTLSKFIPAKPWGSVLLAGIKGVEAIDYWENHFKEKARKWEREGGGGSSSAWVERQAAGGVLALTNHPQPLMGSFPPVPPPPAAPPGMGKRALKRAAAEARRTAGQPKPPTKALRHEEAQRPNWADARKPDGRFCYDIGGTELCYAWGRNEGGCATVCTREPKRAHGCEWCRGPHRTIHCPSHPGWRPDPGDGKGKGKGKKAGK